MKKIITLILVLIGVYACKPKGENMREMNGDLLLFVGTYTEKEGHVDGQADGIYALSFNSETGDLAKTNLQAKTTNPSYLTVDAFKQKLYVVNEKVGPGEAISAFSYDDQGITAIGTAEALGGAPCYIMQADGHLFTANYVGGNHVVYKLNDDGTIGEKTDEITNQYMPKGMKQKTAHAHMIVQNPHTKQVLTVDLGLDQVSFYDFDKSNGKLNISYVLELEQGAGPRHIAFGQYYDMMYVINEKNGSIDVVKKVSGRYESVQNIVSTKMGDPSLAGCADIHMHPSGKFLYASNRGPYNSISQFKIHMDGQLEMIGEIPSGGEAPRSFAIDPSGKFLLAANQNSDNISIFKINEKTGVLTDTGKQLSAPTPVCLKFE